MLELALHQVHKHVLPGAQHPGLLGVGLHRAQHRVCARHDDLRSALVRLQRENMVAGTEQWSPLLTLARVLYSLHTASWTQRANSSLTAQLPSVPAN